MEGERKRGRDQKKVFGSCDSGEVFEDFSPTSEVESVGDPFWVFGVRVPAVLPSVPVVKVPLSSVDVVCEVVSSDSHCESVEPQTFSLARETRRKREACFVERREQTNSGESTASNQKKGYRAYSSAKSAAAT